MSYCSIKHDDDDDDDDDDDHLWTSASQHNISVFQLSRYLLRALDRCAVDEVGDGNKYLAVFIISMVLQGVGSVPLYVLGITYMDDASSHVTSSVHIGNFI